MDNIIRSLDRYSKVISMVKTSCYSFYTYEKAVDEFGFNLPELVIEGPNHFEMRWLKGDRIHNSEGPAILSLIDDIYAVEWYKNDIQHRDDRDENGRVLPARIKSNGTQFWFKNGERHRDDLDDNGRVLPTVIWGDGSRFWYKNDKLHRDDRDENGRVLPAVIYSDGTKEWWINGELHRDDLECGDSSNQDGCENGSTLPAIIESDGTCTWYKDGKLYREENGLILPAVIYSDGTEERWKDEILQIDDGDLPPSTNYIMHRHSKMMKRFDKRFT